MKSNLFVTGLLLNGEPSFTTNNPVTNKLYFTKEKFVHEEIVCFYLTCNGGGSPSEAGGRSLPRGVKVTVGWFLVARATKQQETPK